MKLSPFNRVANRLEINLRSVNIMYNFFNQCDETKKEKFEGRETIYLFRTESDELTDEGFYSYRDMLERLEFNEYLCRVEQVYKSEAGVFLLFSEINPVSVKPSYRVYWIPVEYHNTVEGLPIIFEHLYEPEEFGDLEYLNSRKVLIKEVKSYKRPGRNEREGGYKRYPSELYSLCFSI